MDVQFMAELLPDHYRTTATNNGVQCDSKTGIVDDEHWGYIMKAIKAHFGGRFQEVYHQTSTHHVHFIVYVTSQEVLDRKLEAALVIAQKSVLSGTGG